MSVNKKPEEERDDHIRSGGDGHLTPVIPSYIPRQPVIPSYSHHEALIGSGLADGSCLRGIRDIHLQCRGKYQFFSRLHDIRHNLNIYSELVYVLTISRQKKNPNSGLYALLLSSE